MTMSKGFRYGLAGLAAAAVLCAGPAFAQEAEEAAEAASTVASPDVQYIFNTLLFLIGGFLVMWMAAGFSMLEAGLVRAKNTTEILTKNVALFAVACTMYMACGYNFMWDGGWFLSAVETVSTIDVKAALDTSAKNGFEGHGLPDVRSIQKSAG